MYDRSMQCTQAKITQRWDRFLKENRIAGIDSDVYPDSLLNMLKPLVQAGTITQQDSDDLINLLRTLTAENNIVLEAIGGPEEDPRMYSSQSTWQLNTLIDALGLSAENRTALDATLNQWAKLNSVRFHPDPAPEAIPTSVEPPETPPIGPEDEVPVGPEDEDPPEDPEITAITGADDGESIGPDDDGADAPTGPDDDGAGEEEEPSSIRQKADDALSWIKQKASDAVPEKLPTAQEIELALDAATVAGMTGYGEAIATPAAFGSLVVNLYQKDWDDALIDVVSLVPVAGKAFKVAAKGGKIAKTLKHAEVAAKIAKKVKKAKAGKSVSDAIGKQLAKIPPEQVQQIKNMRKFLDALEDVPWFKENTAPLLSKYDEMMDALNTAKNTDPFEVEPEPAQKQPPIAAENKRLSESQIKRWQDLAGIKKRVL